MRKKEAIEPRLTERTQDPVVNSSNPAPPVSILNPNSIDFNDTSATAQEKQIRELAFWLYEERGRRDGHDVEDWLEAEAIVRNRDKQAA